MWDPSWGFDGVCERRSRFPSVTTLHSQGERREFERWEDIPAVRVTGQLVIYRGRGPAGEVTDRRFRGNF